MNLNPIDRRGGNSVLQSMRRSQYHKFYKEMLQLHGDNDDELKCKVESALKHLSSLE